MKNQKRDPNGVKDELLSIVNECEKMDISLKEGNTKLNKDNEVISDCYKQIEEIKNMLSPQIYNIKSEEMLDLVLKSKSSKFEKDVDLVKSEKANMFKEITSLRDLLDTKTQ